MSLSVAGTANVELWNDDTQTVLKRLVVHNTGGAENISTDVRFKAPAPAEYPGWGIWRITPVIPDGDDLEVPRIQPRQEPDQRVPTLTGGPEILSAAAS